jgi:serine/threonine-protein kinase
VEEIPSLSEAAVVGTPAYMAPEQLAGEPLSCAADIFALGAVMWEMLSGQRLLGKLKLGELLCAHADWTPPDVRERFPGVSDELSSAIETCLARLPADRRVNLAQLAAWAAPATTTLLDLR